MSQWEQSACQNNSHHPLPPNKWAMKTRAMNGCLCKEAFPEDSEQDALCVIPLPVFYITYLKWQTSKEKISILTQSFRVFSLWANSMLGAFRVCILNDNSGEDVVGNTRKGPGSLSQSEAKPLPGTQGPLTRLPRGGILPISPLLASPLLPPYSSPSPSLSSFLSPYFSPLLFLWKKIRSQNSLHKVFVWSLTWNTLL